MKNKNIIYFYRDWYYLTEELSIMQKGYVWDWFVSYINDLEPSFPTDEASKGVCIVLKGILKRDLAKWNAEFERRSEAGKKGMEKRWQQSEEITNDNKNNNVINVKQNITNDNKNNIDNDIDIVKDKEKDKVIDKDKDIYIQKEEDDILAIQKLILKVEELLQHNLSSADSLTIRDFRNKGLTDEMILRDLELYKAKSNNPIIYMKKALENAKIQEQVKPKQMVQEQKTYEINCWLDAFNILHDDEAPQYMRDKAKEYMNNSKRGD